MTNVGRRALIANGGAAALGALGMLRGTPAIAEVTPVDIFKATPKAAEGIVRRDNQMDFDKTVGSQYFRSKDNFAPPGAASNGKDYAEPIPLDENAIKQLQGLRANRVDAKKLGKSENPYTDKVGKPLR